MGQALDVRRSPIPATLTAEQEPVNLLVMGDGGTGKTTDVAALARFGKVLLVNAEQGIKAGALQRWCMEKHGEDFPVENIQIYPDPDDESEQITMQGLEQLWANIRQDLHADPKSWLGVGWDSVTEIQKKFADLEKADAVAKANRRGQERDPLTMDQDNWRRVNDMTRQLVRKYRDLPCHFGMTALLRREQDDDDKVVYQPAVTPGLQNDLIGWMDIACVKSVRYVPIDDVDEYVGLFKPHGKFRGKDRYKIMPKWLIDPTYDRVVQYVRGGITVDTDEIMQEAKDRQARQAEASATDQVTA